MSALSMTLAEKNKLDIGFSSAFGAVPDRYFSAPGRTEISGNHTDHQRGRVLAAAVNLDTRAAVRRNGADVIRVKSEGYPLVEVRLSELEPVVSEVNTTPALVRGVAAGFAQLGCRLEGFDAYVESTVLPGSGLSSSAAYEVLIGTIINHLFLDQKANPAEVARIGQYAENVFFGKPCGLMDQTASAVGGLVTIDFAEQGKIRSVDFDFSKTGHALCIVDSRADHADLTDEYAAITRELKAVCDHFGKEVLTQVNEEDFLSSVAQLREKCGDRAVMRAFHVFRENRRVAQQVACLENDDFEGFLHLARESGISSWTYMQNVIPSGNVQLQAVAVALALCEQYLQGRGACRVHGGGFAGTVQAFVPYDILDSFRRGIDGALGDGACHVLKVRLQGGTEMMLCCNS